MADSGDDSIAFKLDLDGSSFLKGMNEAKFSLGELAKASSSIELAAQFAIGKDVIEAFGVAVELVGKAMEAVFDGENIMAVNKQFDLLTENAGISGEALKRSLAEASGGLIDETKLLETANQALVTLGGNATKLKEVMELSRKVASAYGGDLNEKFQEFTRVLETGNVRMLRQYGIVVDAAKAVREYGIAHNIPINALSELQKKQAISNAAIDESQKKFKDISVDIRENKDSYTKLKVAITEAGDAGKVLLDRVFGPIFKATFNEAGEVITTLTNKFKMLFPANEAEKVNATLTDAEHKLVSLKAELNKNSEGERSIWAQLFGKNLEEERNKILQEIDSVQGVIDFQKEKQKNAETSKEGKTKTSGPSLDDLEKQKKVQLEFQQSLLAMRKANDAAEFQVEDDHQKSMAIIAKKYAELDQGLLLDYAKLKNKQDTGEITDASQVAAMKTEIDRKYYADKRKLIEDTKKDELQSYSVALKTANTTASGISAGFKKGAADAKAANKDFGAQGSATYDNYKKHSIGAIKDIVVGHKNATDVMKAATLGMLGDEATHKGELILAESIWPPNPLGLAAGAGLVALGGVLSGLAGGGGDNASSGGGGGGGSVGAASVDTGTPTSSQLAAPSKGVTIQVQGSFFNTEQTRQQLTEMVRNETDATDFKYVQIGKN